MKGSLVGRPIGAAFRSLQRGGSRTWGALTARVRRDPKAAASTGFVAIAAIGLIAAMVLADGFRASTFDLEDAGVWVTRTDKNQFGRINTLIAEQDDRASNDDVVDIVQDGLDVFVVGKGSLTEVNPADLTTGPSVAVPEDSEVGLAGGTLAVLTPEGSLRAMDPVDAAQLEDSGDAASTDAVDVGEGATMEVGRDGSTAVASPQRQRLLRVERDGETTEVRAGELSQDAQVTMVGDEVIGLEEGRVLLPGGDDVTVPGEGHQLQLPGDRADSVLVASTEGLFSVPVAGGEPDLLSDGQGTPTPIRPARIGRCVHAAWGGPDASYLWGCGDGPQKPLLLTEVPNGGDRVAAAMEQGDVRFRVNRDHVVLNDLRDGLVFAVVGGEVVVASDWDETDPEETTDDEDGDPDPTPDLEFDSKENQPPEANDDDELGARPGLPTIATVLDNDRDPNSDVLTVIELSEASGGEVVPIQGGRAVQVTPGINSEQVTFTYRAFDGVEASERAATVTVTVYDSSVQNPPERKEDRNTSELTVGARSVGTYPVLDDFIDPEGDPIVLSGASVDDAAGAKVSAQTDGLLTYVDESGVAGQHDVGVRIEDAPLLSTVVAEGVDDKVDVTVTAEGVNSPPTARNDFVTTVVGQPVIVWPLRNDDDPDGDDLSFRLLPEGEVPAVAVDNGDGSVTVTPTTAEPVLFGYELSDGSTQVQARIRVDVLADAESQPPSAALDLVVLPAPSVSGRPAERTVDLLANDFSPGGAVMVVTEVRLDDPAAVSGLELQLLEHRRLRVAYAGRLTAPVLATYVLHDGANSVEGKVLVVSSSSSIDLPPLAIDDEISVRAGDVVNVPVLANDIEPEGAPLHLVPELAQGPGEGEGIAFVAGSRVRFLAPDQPMQVELTYVVADDPDQNRANSSTGRLTISVRDGADNQAPRPPLVEARTLAGSQVKITVPLSGVDPDGDSVTLLGLGLAGSTPQSPTKGRIVDMGVDWFLYEAFEGESGTDVFRYRVVDSGGRDGEPLEGEGVVRVGVVPRPDLNQAPVARSDTYEVRPGSRVTLDPLSNDYDPEGDAISLTEVSSSDGLDVEAVEGRVRAQVPDAEGSTSFTYGIEDQWGEEASGSVRLIADDDALGMRPVARDDVAVPEADERTVTVAVLDNDDDPDGDRDALEVSLIDGAPGQATVADSGALRITLTDRSQVVPYLITDEQDLTATAVVRVPPAGESVDLPPRLRDDVEPIEVSPDGEVSVDIGDYVVDPEGEDIRFASARVVPVRVQARVISESELVVSQPSIDSGDAAVGVIVTDGAEGNQGQQAALTLPVRVATEGNQPPVWRTGLAIRVGAVSDETFERDLRELVEDPDGDRLTFEVRGTPDGGDVDIDVDAAGQLTAFVTEDGAELGGRGQVELTVTDSSSQEVRRTAPVEVIASRRPLPTLASLRVDAEAGEPMRVDVLDGSTNPFGNDRPLVLDAKSLQVADGDGQADADKDVLVFTSEPDFVGTAVVSFLVQDAAGRSVPGTATFTVRSEPAQPARPTVRQVSASSVEVAWSTPANNGSPITGYQVISSRGGSTDCGVSLACVITGLRPGEAVSFQVVATNDLGEGEASPPSVQITPDECPSAPTNVQLRFDPEINPAGGVLVATWDEPEFEGTPVEGYDVRLNGQGVRVADPGRVERMEITGLENGERYQMTLRAKNSCEGGLGAPGQSGFEIPAGLPEAPIDVQAARVDDRSGGRVLLSWTAPALKGLPSANGAAVEDYVVRQDGVVRDDVAVLRDQTSVEVAVDREASDLTFTLAAVNRAGEGPQSAASAPVTARGEPSAPSATARLADSAGRGLNGAVALDITPPADDGGNPNLRYEWSLNGGPWQAVSPVDGTAGASNLPNSESDLDFRLQACNDQECSDPPTAVPGVRPYAPLAPPAVSPSVPRLSSTVTFNWSPSTAPSGSTIVRSIVSGDASATRSGGSGSVDISGDYDRSYSVTVTFEDSRGQRASSQVSRASTAPTQSRSVSDSFLGGTWTRNATHGGAWGNRNSRPAGAIDWYGNGTGVRVVCMSPGGSYEVVWADGRREQWSWHARLSNGHWVRAAVLYNGDGNSRGVQC